MTTVLDEIEEDAFEVLSRKQDQIFFKKNLMSRVLIDIKVDEFYAEEVAENELENELKFGPDGDKGQTGDEECDSGDMDNNDNADDNEANEALDEDMDADYNEAIEDVDEESDDDHMDMDEAKDNDLEDKDNDLSHEAYLINMMSMWTEDDVVGDFLDDSLDERFEKKNDYRFEKKTYYLWEDCKVLSREIGQIGINNDEEEYYDNDDIRVLYQSINIRQNCSRLESATNDGHFHLIFSNPKTYSPQEYKIILKDFFLKKIEQYFPSKKCTPSEQDKFVQCFGFDINLAQHNIFTQKDEMFDQSVDILLALDNIHQLFLLGNKANWENDFEFYTSSPMYNNCSKFKKELINRINQL